MKQVPERLRPWLITAWFVAFLAWNLYWSWSAATDTYTMDDYDRIFLVALSMLLTPAHIALSAIVIGALFIKWKW
jgi:hypothetical protein